MQCTHKPGGKYHLLFALSNSYCKKGNKNDLNSIGCSYYSKMYIPIRVKNKKIEII